MPKKNKLFEYVLEKVSLTNSKIVRVNVNANMETATKLCTQ